MLAVECVTYLHGGDADLDPVVHLWMREMHPPTDEAIGATSIRADVSLTYPIRALWDPFARLEALAARGQRLFRRVNAAPPIRSAAAIAPAPCGPRSPDRAAERRFVGTR